LTRTCLLLACILLVGIIVVVVVRHADWFILDEDAKAVCNPAADPRHEGDWVVTPLGELRSWSHCSEQHRLLVSSHERAPELWDTETRERVAVLQEQRGEIDTCAWSPDKTRFATGGQIGYHNNIGGWKMIVRTIRIWKTATGKLLRRIRIDLSADSVRDSTDWSLRWMDEGTILLELHTRENPARASVRTVLGLLDVERGRVTRWSRPLEIGEALTLSPDGLRAIATREYSFHKDATGGIGRGGRGTTHTVHLIDLDALTALASLDDTNTLPKGGPLRSIGDVAWSPDGNRIATVGSDHTVRIWDGHSGVFLSTLTGHTDFILSTCFSADGRMVLTASEDNTARVWDSTTGNSLAVLAGHTAGLYQAVFDPTGRLAATASEDQTARLWEAATGKQLRIWAGHESNVCRVEFLDAGRQVSTRTARGFVRGWSAETGALVSERKPERKASYRYGNCFLRDSRSGTEMWVGPPGAIPPPVDDGRMRIVIGESEIMEDSPNARLAEARQVLKGHKGHIVAVAFSADGQLLASAGEDKAVILWEPKQWDPATGKGRVILHHGVEPRAVALAVDRRVAAVGCQDGSIRLWDLDGGKQRLLLKKHDGPVLCLAFAPDGAVVASSGLDRLVTVWEAGGGKQHFAVAESMEVVSAVAFSTDGKQLAVGGDSQDAALGAHSSERRRGEVVLRDAVTGEELHRLRCHEERIAALAFTPDGKVLASASDDKSIKLWDTTTGKQCKTLAGHKEWVRSVAISADGRWLASGDWGGTIRLWELPEGKEVASFRGQLVWVDALAFSPDGKTLASGSSALQLWDVAEMLKRSARAAKPPP
jgi:WD40 repeat protein